MRCRGGFLFREIMHQDDQVSTLDSMTSAAAAGSIASGTPAYRRLALAMVIAGFATFALLYSVQSLLPVFSREFQVSAGEASLVVSLATGAMAITLLVASVISDRIGR